MVIRSIYWFALFLLSIFIANRPGEAAAPLARVIMTSGSASERDGAVYVAQDQGLFRKYGLDLSFVQVRNGPVAMSALSSGETQFHWGSVSGANLGAIADEVLRRGRIVILVERVNLGAMFEQKSGDLDRAGKMQRPLAVAAFGMDEGWIACD